MRILIIEDEVRLAENIGRSLRESAGYAVDIATDGEEGLFLVGDLCGNSDNPTNSLRG